MPLADLAYQVDVLDGNSFNGIKSSQGINPYLMI